MTPRQFCFTKKDREYVLNPETSIGALEALTVCIRSRINQFWDVASRKVLDTKRENLAFTLAEIDRRKKTNLNVCRALALHS